MAYPAIADHGLIGDLQTALVATEDRRPPGAQGGQWQSTLDAIERTLISDSLVYRYDPKASHDGLRGEEGTFSICTFWFVDARARSGRLAESRVVLEKMLTYANHVGLFAEEVGPTGEQLGNFPQGFTHLSLINAAIDLDHGLDQGARG